jgi:hypothetical protein
MVMMIPSKLTHIKKNSYPKNPKKNTTSMIINLPSIHPSIIPWKLGVRKKAPFPTNQSSQSNNIIYLLSQSSLTFARKEKKRKY